jgi:hypothetical protein
MKQLNWRDNLDEVLLAMEKVEGDTWLMRQLETLDDSLLPHWSTIAGAMRYLQLLDKDDDFLRQYCYAEVYGSGGFNRYYWRLDGAVEFSLSHAISTRACEKAKQARFIMV